MPLTKATQNVVEGIVSTGSTGVSAGSFIVGQQYKITSLGTTTQSQWNTIAGTTGQTYVVGSLFTAATIGAGSGNGAAAVARTLANRFADVVNVLDFGADPTGVIDSTPFIQNAIDNSEGKTILIPKGIYKITQTLTITKSGINLIGSSLAQNVFTDTTELGSVLKWSGGASPVISINVGGGSQSAVSGGSIQRLKIDGQNLATKCLQTQSCMAYRFEDLKLIGATFAAWDITGSEPYGSGFNDFYQCVSSNISIVCLGSCIGLYSGATSNTGTEITGEHPAFSDFLCLHITYENGTAINLIEADDCTFTNIGISRRIGGTGDAIVLDYGTHGNHFRCVNVSHSASDPVKPKIIAKSGSMANYMEFAGIDHNIKPTLESGSELFYIYLGRNGVSNQAIANLPAIKFPNIGNSDLNSLDWFEQGDWYPTLTFGGNSTGITYSSNFGRYQRIGRVVTASANIALTNKGTATGIARINDLPFVAGTTTDVPGSLLLISGFTGISSGGTALQIDENATTAILRIYQGGSGVISITDTNMTNTSQFTVALTYSVL
jgi:hypothetical protein